MMVEFLVLSVAVFISARLLDGVEIRSFMTALGVALGISLVNVIIKPILVILSLPVIILSLGLFILFINAALILLIDKFVDGLRIRSFSWALIFSLLISVISTGLNTLL
ncbi:MAG: phage holin family protein [Bacteroidetes bacterium]|nr:phage holin family protein [Bacteroidota bacterium]